MERTMAEQNVKLHPLVEYDLGTLPEECVLISLRLVTGDRRPATEAEKESLCRWLQVSLSADQADALADALRTIAGKSRERESALRQ